MILIGTGSYLPEHIVTNDDLSKLVDTSDEWIYKRTGIKERHIVKEESTVDMAVKASEKALQESGVQAEEIDLIIVATFSADNAMPSTACQVQSGIGAKNAVAFDINAACTGFLFALNMASAFFDSGKYNTALVIGAETMSKMLDWKDRSTCILFGDGAGAVVAKKGGQYSYNQYSNGEAGEVLMCGSRDKINPLIEEKGRPNYISMNGRSVFEFVLQKIPVCIEAVIKEAGIDKDSISYVLLHQANVKMIKGVARQLRMPEEKFPVNIDRCGNTSAASLPILLDEMNRSGKLKNNNKIVLSGFGGGLTWGAAVLNWG